MILKDFLRYPGVIHTFQSIVKGKEIKNFQILPLYTLFQSIDKGHRFNIRNNLFLNQIETHR